MKIDDVIMEVTTIRDAMSSIITEPSRHVLTTVIADLISQRDLAIKSPKKTRKAQKAEKPPWKLVILPETPLSFRNTENEAVIKHRLEVDLACSLSEPDAKGIPRGEHNIAVRVWSTDSALCFREDIDAESLRAPIGIQGRRVMLRFHFDLANKDQQGPRHHLQMGGKGMTADYHWLPDNWKLPRFLHFPVNLALVCEFIGRTFYPDGFRRISQEPTWRHAVKAAEEAYVFPFLSALPYITIDPRRRTDSLLSSVWNG